MTSDSVQPADWTLEAYDQLSFELRQLQSSSAQVDPSITNFASAVLNREAFLLDSGEFESWMSMMTPDSVYWIPASTEIGDPMTNVALAFDDNRRLDDRVYWLRTGLVSAQLPASRTSRIIGNVEAWQYEDDLIFARSSFHLQEFRAGRYRLLSGRYGHVISGNAQGPITEACIKTKITFLIDADQGHDNLTLIF